MGQGDGACRDAVKMGLARRCVALARRRQCNREAKPWADVGLARLHCRYRVCALAGAGE
jgi:hypothetical protein